MVKLTLQGCLTMILRVRFPAYSFKRGLTSLKLGRLLIRSGNDACQ